MLVLGVGATGNVGQHLIDSLLVRGHQVRALAHNSSKRPAQKLEKLEAFVTSRNYYDIDVLDSACTGVDAVICTYTGIPELQLDAQLLLLRTAKRAGRHASGIQESYDPIISFRRHADLSSSIRSIYILSGVLAEVLFSVPGHGDFSPKNYGIFGAGEEPWHWTTEKDAPEFAAEIIQRDDAPQGSFWTLCSGVNTLPEIAGAYECVKGSKVNVQYKGTVSDLIERALEATKQGSEKNYWIDGTWTLKGHQNDLLDVQTTSLEEFLRNNSV
ncbi:hypothetical protein BGW37DRAFT_514952 [Umbelopsis sp. PMI_123]|nr:hypothetical protein BGW37DRAFT_514952 [Umbelopsis sp. PMI_123]